MTDTPPSVPPATTADAALDDTEASPTERLARPLVLLSHRGPVGFSRSGDERTASRGSGGLVTALVGLAEHLDEAVWVCAASGEEDEAVAEEAGGRAVTVVTSTPPHLAAPEEQVDSASALQVRMVPVAPELHEPFYTVVSNPLLWFVQHGLYGQADAPVITADDHAAIEAYAAVNEQFAGVVCEEVEARGGGALVMIQDYHFYLVAEHVRKRCPRALLSHFVHIPWPGPDAWRILPPPVRNRFVRGLLGSDVVGFHTARYARNFAYCVQEMLGLEVDMTDLSVEVDGRRVLIRHYPISVDPAALDSVLASEQAADHRARLYEEFVAPVWGAGADAEDDEHDKPERQLIVRVDRTDPSKNVVRGFLAFGTLLDQHPELIGRLSFLALLQPSRTDVPEYATYLANIGAAVTQINGRHTTAGRQPIDLRLVEDFPLAVAAYSICDVLMVNALADGMNLVAKEVPVVSRRNSVLALSETTGAYEELGEHAVTLYPFDIQQTADALYTALTMDADERRRRREAAARQIREHDVAAWLDRQLVDLEALDPGPDAAGGPA